VTVERSIDLPCPIAEAWDVLTRWERQVDWMLDADEIVVRSEQRDGVGVRLDVRTRLFQIPAFTEPMEVTAWDPPRSLAIAHGGLVAGHGSWALAPVDGGTRFTWTEDVELRVPVVGGLAAGIYAPVMRVLMGRAQVGLRRLIIASGPAPG
jgi:carbon monoxide dehydrogenase subunit G